MDTDPLLHTTVDDFTFREVLGRGSFATVYKAEAGGGLLAVKTLCKQGMSQPQLKLQLQESSLLATLDHPHIIRLERTVHTQDHIHLVMPYCPSDLFDAIMQDQGFSSSTSKRLFSQLCSAVAACHANGIFHRDLKPENVLINKDGVLLADFGLATTHMLSTDFGCGSVRYMAPECWAGVRSTSGALPYSCAANDVWALGIILINMLTGKNPWVEPSRKDKHFRIHMLNPTKQPSARDSFNTQFGFSDEMCALLRRVFHPDPFKRPSAIVMGQAIAGMTFFQKSFVPAVPKALPLLAEKQPSVSDLMFALDGHDSPQKRESPQTKSKQPRNAPPPGVNTAFTRGHLKEAFFSSSPRTPRAHELGNSPATTPSRTATFLSALSSVFFEPSKLF